MKPWQTHSRQTVLTHGRYLTVEMHQVRLPDGNILSDWPWLITPDFINVLAETEDGLFPCFRQAKYAAHGLSLAPVGGFIEPGEKPAAAARRELLEETGYTARQWYSLGHYAVDANRGNGRAYFYLARGARRIGAPTGGDLEEQQLLLLDRPRLDRALARGEFKILPWAAVVALGLRKLDQLRRPSRSGTRGGKRLRTHSQVL